MNSQIYDKIINVELYERDPKTGASVVNKITCPLTGRKPHITFSGQMFAATAIVNHELRIKNLSLETPLTDIRFLRVTCGYRGGIQSTIEGTVLNAYQDKPGPDGDTTFHILYGNIYTFLGNCCDGSIYAKGTPITDVFNGLISLMPGFELSDKNGILKGVTLVKDICPEGRAKDAIISLAKNYLTFQVGFIGSSVLITNEKYGSGQEYVLNYLTQAPRLDAGQMTIIAPWNPEIRALDTVLVDSKYIKQTYGGALVTDKPIKFTVLTVDFNFSTVDDTNTMTLITTPDYSSGLTGNGWRNV